ncbi:hypothetical protein ACXG8I_002375, partial [Enterobacter hormaechei]
PDYNLARQSIAQNITHLFQVMNKDAAFDRRTSFGILPSLHYCLLSTTPTIYYKHDENLL